MNMRTRNFPSEVFNSAVILFYIRVEIRKKDYILRTNTRLYSTINYELFINFIVNAEKQKREMIPKLEAILVGKGKANL